MGIAGSLIALALGYMVFIAATKEKGQARSFGRILGAFVIIAAFCGTICGVIHKSGAYGTKTGCELMAKCGSGGMMKSSVCPMGGMKGK